MLPRERLVILDDLAGVRRHAAHGSYEAGFRAALHFVVGFVGADRFDEVVPFQLVGIRLRLRERPHDVFALDVLTFEDLALRRAVAGAGNEREPFGPVRIGRELAVAALDVAALEEKLCAVCEGELRGISIEVLIHPIVAIVAPAIALGLDRPRALHPAGLVDVVNVEVAIRAAARPEEAVEAVDLVVEFLHVIGLLLRAERGHRCLHAIRAQQEDVAEFTLLDARGEFLAPLAVPAHEAHGDLHVFRHRQLVQIDHPPRGRAVGGDRLFHEDVDALLDRVFVMHPAERHRRGEDRDATRLQRVDGILVAIEAHELPVLRHIDLCGMLRLEALQAAFELPLEHIRHRHQLDRRAGHGERVRGSAGAAATAADERDLEGVVLRCVDEGDFYASQHGDGGGGFEEAATGEGSRFHACEAAREGDGVSTLRARQAC